MHLAIHRAAKYELAVLSWVVMLVSLTFCFTYSSFFFWKKSSLLFECSEMFVFVDIEFAFVDMVSELQLTKSSSTTCTCHRLYSV